MSNERRQYIVLLELMKRHDLSEVQAAEALWIFFFAPNFEFCRAVRFVWRVRNPVSADRAGGRGPDAAPVTVPDSAGKDAAG